MILAGSGKSNRLLNLQTSSASYPNPRKTQPVAPIRQAKKIPEPHFSIRRKRFRIGSMKRILLPLLTFAVLAPLTASAVLLNLSPPEGAPDQDGLVIVADAQPKTVDLLNDPEPFRMTPEGFELTSFSGPGLALAEMGNSPLLYVAKRDDQREQMMMKIEAKIKELKKAGKKDQAAAIEKKLAAIKQKAEQEQKKPAPKAHEHKAHEHKAHEHADSKSREPRANDRATPQNRKPDNRGFSGAPRGGPGRAPMAQRGARPQPLSSPRAGRGRPDLRNQLQGKNVDEHKKMHHMRSAMMHLRAAGANDIADRIEKGLKAHGEKLHGQLREDIKRGCPDCKKDSKACPKCDKDKACPNCKKDGKACPKCEKGKAAPECKKDGKPTPKCDKDKACPNCKKDGKACPKCEKGKAAPECNKDGKPAPKCDKDKACPDCKKDGKACPKCEKGKA
ncbi:MAG: hypothetical protein ACI9UA_004641, partial [Pseudoalteromonas tetraodonis]